LTEAWVLKVIGRDEAPTPIKLPRFGRVLITGGEGSIGAALAERLRPTSLDAQQDVLLTDIKTMDVRDERNVMTQFLRFEPELVIHLAASKHAPLGEEDPYEVVRTNVEGTHNVLDWANRIGAKVIVASTCKACDPETAYGASKLVAERMALNAGQVVVRYYNVVETSGNVFEIWRSAREAKREIRYTNCSRRFTTLNEALNLTLWTASWAEEGRYSLTHTVSRSMRDVAVALHPETDYGGWLKAMPSRRGDREEEPRHAACERMEEMEGCEWISRVWNPHDPHYRKETNELHPQGREK
jgi:UDP-glucose 4-epimerase